MEEVKALYDEEMGQPARMGHKLSHKVLSPSNIDKSALVKEMMPVVWDSSLYLCDSSPCLWDSSPNLWDYL